MLIDIQKDFNRLNYLMQDSLLPTLMESVFDDSEIDFDENREPSGAQVGDNNWVKSINKQTLERKKSLC